jgi:hypothetical protein
MIPHLSSHEDAELYALKTSLALHKLGAFFATLEIKLGEIAIFDPDAEVKENTVKDGISFCRSLCEYLTAEGTKHGLGPEAFTEQWKEMCEAALAFEVNRRKGNT